MNKNFLPAIAYVCLLVFAPFVTFSQNARAYGNYVFSEMSLDIGDRVPENFYSTIHEAVYTHTGQTTSITLADYRHKLIILDFWASWCGPCIGWLSKLDSTSKVMVSEDFVVLPVSYEQTSSLQRIWDHRQWDFLAIVRDSILGKTFPTSSLPHQVWIKDDKVIAMPKSAYATAENIRRIINGEEASDFLFSKTTAHAVDPSRPAFVEGNGLTGAYYKTPNAVIARYLPSYRYKRTTYSTHVDTTVLLAVNQSVLALYFQAYKYEIFQPFAARFSVIDSTNVSIRTRDELNKRLHWYTSAKIPHNIEADRLRAAWEAQNLYGYEFRAGGHISDTLARQYMQKDLNDFFGLYLGIEAKIVADRYYTYGVLRLKEPRSQALKLLTAEEADIRKKNPMVSGLKRIRFDQGFFLGTINNAILNGRDLTVTAPLVDSTGIAPETLISVHFPKSMRDGWTLKQINDELARYGVYVAVETKKVPILVIDQKNI